MPSHLPNMSPRLAYIGLGNIGRGIATNLASKGKLESPLLLYNRTFARAQELAAELGPEKASAVSTVKEAVGSADIIFLCLGDDAAVRDTVKAALETSVEGKLFVDNSTIHPDTTDEICARLKEKGAEFVACPVFGAPPMAVSGQLICVLSGPAESVAKVVPYTTGVIGRMNIDLSGEACGKALLLKLIGNTFIVGMVEALAQGHTLAEKSGLGAENLHKWIELMFPGPYTAYSNRMLSGDYFGREKPAFAVDLALKDVNHALELGERSETKLPSVEVAKNHLLSVKEHEGPTGDIAGIYGASRKESGLKFENK